MPAQHGFSPAAGSAQCLAIRHVAVACGYIRAGPIFIDLLARAPSRFCQCCRRVFSSEGSAFRHRAILAQSEARAKDSLFPECRSRS